MRVSFEDHVFCIWGKSVSVWVSWSVVPVNSIGVYFNGGYVFSFFYIRFTVISAQRGGVHVSCLIVSSYPSLVRIVNYANPYQWCLDVGVVCNVNYFVNASYGV